MENKFQDINTLSKGDQVELPPFDIKELFEKSVKKFPDNTAIITTAEVKQKDMFRGNDINYRIEDMQGCFRLHIFTLSRKLNSQYTVWRSSENHCLILSNSASDILKRMDGSKSIWETYLELQDDCRELVIEFIHIDKPVCVEHQYNVRYELQASKYEHIHWLVSKFYQLGFVEIVKKKMHLQLKKQIINWNQNLKGSPKMILSQKECLKTDILLLGDKPGTAAVGLLYLASYLQKNNVQARCLFVNEWWENNNFEDELYQLLDASQPSYVGLSMKWFPHIYRVLQMAKLIKKHNESIKIIIGGDTASYFAKEFIKEEVIDYVVIGDGEEPLYKICQGFDDIPNCIYKRNNEIITGGIMLEHNCSAELFQIDEIVLDPQNIVFTSLYIPTSRGCTYDCIQCGGTKKIQNEVYQKNNCSCLRPSELVRNDMICTMPYTTAYMFSLSGDVNENIDYFRKVWEGLDLSDTSLALFGIALPDENILRLACETFKYVRLGIDICSLSQRQRESIAAQTNCKPQPTDEEIICLIKICEEYPNCEVDIHTIAGMPYLIPSDFEMGKIFIKKLLSYKSFKSLQWGKLHAQPGTSLSLSASNFDMDSTAKTYLDFYYYSKRNYESQIYPEQENYNYPYVYYKDKKLNEQIIPYFIQLSLDLEHTITNRTKLIYEEIDYATLHEASDRVAAYLSSVGITSENNVILLINHRILFAIGLLALVKSGIAYIPLDEQFHKEMLHKVKTEVSCSGILSDCTLEEGNLSIPISDIINFDIDIPIINKNYYNHILYRIYSSGTTSNLKVISLKQKGIINYTLWRNDKYRLKEDDVILQLLSEAFDGFGSNFYSALLSGAKLLMPSKKHNKDYMLVRNMLIEHKVTNMSLVPIMYELMLEVSKQPFKSLKSVVLAGETSSLNCIKLSKEINPNTMLISEYGPTENSIASTAYIGLDEKTLNCIGKPIQNVNTYIITKDEHIAGFDEEGEICLSGIGLLDGFELDSCDSIYMYTDRNEPLYRTGDLGMWCKNGNIIFLGRKDRNIKLSGIKIHLDDVERALLSNDGIKEAAVLAANDNMIAYVVLNPDGKLHYIKQGLETHLAAYQIPNQFIVLDQLPRLPGGKIDYQLLKKTSINRQGNMNTEMTDTEKWIYSLWEHQLGNNQFNQYDSFFDIGGNSLMIMKIYNEINKDEEIVSVTDLFEYTTIQKLGVHIDTIKKNSFSY
ncbi:hypothetical protein acsn021_17480 [Anaerocolumna cellulosilytica]|uniref:Uncharacterized protein n=1 Tax=Anaerocolumna cellulosilytica TaxID=433286 RepID=A0A6S6QYN2_9FIRM|nr:AMP-binding protein [Anaerocolumna cellulosilytica]MBB5194858.1 acyl-coenzyme A synthetase/AMP-(fatty) acid ligase [Anaerocolumna cellulosilytica]BCJ94179.1 hypothetical protein acsn021_17480 [Anaerocolumna cellulosilytica]